MTRPRRSRRAFLAAAALAGAACAALLPAAGPAHAVGAQPPIKHVWLIILENKSFDATFTGLNNNSYLWKTLPAQGQLLENYFGTGHASLDNYTSLISGQGPTPGLQADCPKYTDVPTAALINDGSVDQGQEPAKTGCVFSSGVQTLFNQLDAKGLPWKTYEQDLGNAANREPGPCGTPGSPAGVGVDDPGTATATDQYVARHNPAAWFHSLIDSPSDCGTGLGASGTAATVAANGHVVNLDNPAEGLAHDLRTVATTPSLSWITPNNCNNAHDSTCAGTNEAGTKTGGLLAADSFLEKYIPMIEASPAFRQDGLIDITFDEAFPPYTIYGNSTANSATPLTAAQALKSDAAPSFGEPAGPNSNAPLFDAAGNVMRDATGVVVPGPGGGASINRTDLATSTFTPINPAGDGKPLFHTDVASAADDTDITDAAISTADQGRPVTSSDGSISAGSVVGRVNPGTATTAGTFGLKAADGSDEPVSSTLSSVTIGTTSGADSDQLYDNVDPTPGGGRTGSVLISRFVKPGSPDTTGQYNHYSWLRTMEDIFGITTGGADGQGHLGYAASANLPGKPATATPAFGSDVFDNPTGTPTRAAATVTGLSPASGPLAGGTTVTVSGSGFTDGNGNPVVGAVLVGGLPATSFTVLSDSSLTAVVPPGVAAGTVDTDVYTLTGGDSTTSAADHYTYLGATDTVTLAASGTFVTLGTDVAFTGKVTSGGAPVAGAPVTLTETYVDGKPVTLGGGVTGSDGTFRITSHPLYIGIVTASSGGGSASVLSKVIVTYRSATAKVTAHRVAVHAETRPGFITSSSRQERAQILLVDSRGRQLKVLATVNAAQRRKFAGEAQGTNAIDTTVTLAPGTYRLVVKIIGTPVNTGAPSKPIAVVVH